MFSFTIGGTERLVTDICNELVIKDIGVHLYIVNNLISDELLAQISNKVVIKKQNRQPSNGDKVRTLVEVAKYVRANKIDVVHCNSLNAPDLVLLAKIINPRLRVLQTFHCMGSYTDNDKVKVLFRNILCNQFIAISDAVRKDVIRYGVKDSSIVTIYNGIDTGKFSSGNKNFINASEIMIACVARIDKAVKGQDILIKAMKFVVNRYPDAVCYFAGGCSKENEADLKELKSEVDRLNLTRNVFFLGNVNDIASFLKNIKIFVLPSREEGFGLSIVEAMINEIPVIASDIDGPREIVNMLQCGQLFKKEDPLDLADKIIKTIEKYSQYKNEVVTKKDLIVQTFDIKNTVQKLMEIYIGDGS